MNTVQAAWESYRDSVIGVAIPEDDLEIARLDFYAGASSIYKAFSEMATTLSENAFEAVWQSYGQEFEAFQEEVNAIAQENPRNSVSDRKH